MLSHWVSVSAGNPAIAVARKVGVLGAPEIENGYPLLLPKLLLFSTFSKITKKHENHINTTLLKVFSSKNGPKNYLFHLDGRCCLAFFFPSNVFLSILVVLWLSFGRPLAPFGSLLAHF